MITRRLFLWSSFSLILGYGLIRFVMAENRNPGITIEKIHKSPGEWKALLSPGQYRVLRKEGTERPHTSPLLHQKEKGVYACAGCDLPLFTSEMKYDSRTGWPSFTTSIPGRLETKSDFKLIYPRTEYHCARCEGHQGHIFKDGPPPTYQRWCNNGVALKFIPDPVPVLSKETGSFRERIAPLSPGMRSLSG